LKKAECGTIKIKTGLDKDNFTFSLRDDGCGIQIGKLRTHLLDSKKATKQELAGWDDQQIAESIFLSGVSTAQKVDMVSGRGVGMDLVKERIGKHNGRIELDYQEGRYCEFTVSLPLAQQN
jgi:two-component system chemotaxis sensor kinase CheA